jgi:VanZ family protein
MRILLKEIPGFCCMLWWGVQRRGREEKNMRKVRWGEVCWRFGPLVLWMAVISSFSTAVFSPEESGRSLMPILEWLFPGTAPATLDLLHAGIRKGMHLTEFGILASLWYRALGWRGTGWQPRTAVAALVLAVGFAGLDEVHQMYEPSRTGRLVDVGWDGLGAALALAGRRVLWS